jgi:5-methylcytosine-specific restriction endonuclease McrA
MTEQPRRQYRISEILRHTQDSYNYNDTILLSGFKVKVSNLRLRTFARPGGTVCASCGLEGKWFVVEVRGKDSNAGLQLYGLNAKGESIRLTLDHVIARSRGGRNRLDNTQTLCEPCNALKADYEPETFEILRAIRSA